MIYGCADLSFMIPTVHVSIDDKVHTACLIHTHNFDVMLIPVIPDIRAFRIAETEYLHNLLIDTVKTPQFTLLNKSNHSTRLIHSIFNLSVSYSKLYAVSIGNKVIFSPENLIRSTLKIQDIHTTAGHAQTIIFFYIIIFRLTFSIHIRCHIRNRNNIIGSIDFLNGSNRITDLLRF